MARTKASKSRATFRKGDRVRVTGASLDRLPSDCGDLGDIERMYGATAAVWFKSKSLGPYVSIIPIGDLRPTRRRVR